MFIDSLIPHLIIRLSVVRAPLLEHLLVWGGTLFSLPFLLYLPYFLWAIIHFMFFFLDDLVDEPDSLLQVHVVVA
jgi:hypothetical protein